MPSTPKRRLHKLRGGDGPSVPTSKPPERWPNLEEIQPHWESFQAFARSDLESPIQFELRLKDNGKWEMRALEAPSRKTNHRKRLVYDPKDDSIEFTDLEVDSGWVLENAFGDPTGATSAL